MDMTQKRIPTLIVGGGIGGLATALAVSQSGRPVHVLERANEFGEIGAGLQLAPNATRIFDRLGILQAIKAHAVVPSRLVWMDALRKQKITEIDLGEPFLARYGAPYLVMHRSDLLNVLLDACRANPLVFLESGKDVVDVETHADYARAKCADGAVYDADLLVGADGLRSKVRSLLCDDQPVCAEYVAYRGTLPMSEMSEHAGLDNVVMWVGPDMHFVQYPVRRGELYNQVAVFRSKRYKPSSDDWGTVEEFDDHFAQTCDYVRACAKQMWRDKRWSMYDREPILNWTRGRVALLGDAAHPMLQYIAQGACQAIEDSMSLAQCIGTGANELAEALARYQTMRAHQAARVQITARAMGKFFHLSGAAAEVRNQMMVWRNATDYSALDWLYGDRTRAVA
jgi:2-polyprenyl-6-methoxyphenol hydroxylase-like FAD-dependent oxidoreductase